MFEEVNSQQSIGDRDPIVIVGMSLEAPGGINTLDSFWHVIKNDSSLMSTIPRERFPNTESIMAQVEHKGWQKIPDSGGFLSDPGKYDPYETHISPREAKIMDPQQRLAVQLAFRALDNAGIDPLSVSGEQAGCFVGSSAIEYGPRVDQINEFTGHRYNGSALSAISGRISYTLGLQGPNMTIDAACASSISALHAAIMAVHNGECDWSLAGGVCVMGSLGAFVEFSSQNGLSPDGKVHPFGGFSSGTTWGEGGAFFVVEKHSRAQALGHNILGYILATRTNHNGHTPALPMPDADAQVRVFQDALQAAKVASHQIDYVEAHATGTSLGDAQELKALDLVYGSTKAQRTCYVGGLKSVTGHTQAASGALSLVKLILCGYYGAIPPIHTHTAPHAGIDWEKSQLCLPSRVMPWEPQGNWRIGALTSAGITGINCHAIVGFCSHNTPY